MMSIRPITYFPCIQSPIYYPHFVRKIKTPEEIINDHLYKILEDQPVVNHNKNKTYYHKSAKIQKYQKNNFTMKRINQPRKY